MSLFRDRADAGGQLARALSQHAGSPNAVVVGLPRGGVPVAAELARRLSLPLDILLVRKLGMPGQEELALGAIAWGGAVFLNRDIVTASGITESETHFIAEREKREMTRREMLYRECLPGIPLPGRDILLVDDGLATGATMRAAVRALRQEAAARIIVAVPVGAAGTCEALSHEADDVVCLHKPDPLRAVGIWYKEFGQTTDAQVMECLRAARTAGRDRLSGAGSY